MNVLVQENFNAFESAVRNLDEQSGILPLSEIGERFELPVRVHLARDRPELWERGFLQVVERDGFDRSINEATLDERAAPKSWTNYLGLGENWYVLLPNFTSRRDFWSVLLFDPGLGIPRPVMFHPKEYRGTRFPYVRCTTNRGDCLNLSCNEPTHFCKKYRGNSIKRGGRYFWCECKRH